MSGSPTRCFRHTQLPSIVITGKENADRILLRGTVLFPCVQDSSGLYVVLAWRQEDNYTVIV
jgi:hypothetical protein